MWGKKLAKLDEIKTFDVKKGNRDYQIVHC